MTIRISVISLLRLPERAAAVSSRLDALGLAHDIFPAIDGARGEHLSWPNYDEAACLRVFGSTLLAAEVACFASHYSLWQQCVESGAPILVLEDDVTLLDGFPDAVATAESCLVTYPFIRLAGLYDRPFREIEARGSRRLVRYSQAPCGLQAYVLAPRAASRLLFGARQWREPVDLYVDRFWSHGILPYAVHPFEVRHEDEAERTSSIGPRLKKRKGWNKLRREVFRLRDGAARKIFNATH